MTGQTFSELNSGELEWVGQLREVARALGIAEDVDVLSDYFDEQRAQVESPIDPNTVVNVVGACVGDILVRELGLGWQVVTDEYGSELGVVGDHGIVILPMNAVGKRWGRTAPGEIRDFVAAAIDSVTAVRSRSAE